MNTLVNQPSTPNINFMTNKFSVNKRYSFRLSSNHQSVISQIKSYGLLEDNWDSYGGVAPSKQVIHRAVDCVKWLSDNRVDVYFTAPSTNGDIVVEIKKGQYNIEFEFSAEGEDCIIQSYNGDIEKETSYNNSTRTLFLNEFMDQYELNI